MRHTLLQATAALGAALFIQAVQAAGWAYFDMGSPGGTAVVDSREAVTPYRVQKATLHVATADGGVGRVWLFLKNQARRPELERGGVRIGFDGGELLDWPVTLRGDDWHSGMVYLDNERNLVERMLGARMMSVELRFANGNREVITFAIADLDGKRLWPHGRRP